MILCRPFGAPVSDPVALPDHSPATPRRRDPARICQRWVDRLDRFRTTGHAPDGRRPHGLRPASQYRTGGERATERAESGQRGL